MDEYKIPVLDLRDVELREIPGTAGNGLGPEYEVIPKRSREERAADDQFGKTMLRGFAALVCIAVLAALAIYGVELYKKSVPTAVPVTSDH